MKPVDINPLSFILQFPSTRLQASWAWISNGNHWDLMRNVKTWLCLLPFLRCSTYFMVLFHSNIQELRKIFCIKHQKGNFIGYLRLRWPAKANASCFCLISGIFFPNLQGCYFPLLVAFISFSLLNPGLRRNQLSFLWYVDCQAVRACIRVCVCE